MDPLLSETCWSTFKYFVILIVSTYYILCICWIINCLIAIDARCKHEDSSYHIDESILLHLEGKRLLRRTLLQVPLTKLFSTRTILWAQAFHLLQLLRLQGLLMNEPPNVVSGSCSGYAAVPSRDLCRSFPESLLSSSSCCLGNKCLSYPKAKSVYVCGVRYLGNASW